MKTNEELLDDQKFIDFEANLLNALDMAIEPRHKLIIFDHTTSNTGINLPIKKMSKICKKYGGKIVIDGAVHTHLSDNNDLCAECTCLLQGLQKSLPPWLHYCLMRGQRW